MALEKIARVTGRAVYVQGEDIDTDRIIPARFMKCVTFDGLGEFLFYDVRFDLEGKTRNHCLDRPEHRGATILISGNNFGCGSSREHAPQALRKFGIRSVIAGGFAEIFFGNSTTLGMPCVSVSDGDRQRIIEAIEKDPSTEVTIDLESEQVRFADQQVPFKMQKQGARKALLAGQWDPITVLLDAKEKVAELESSLAY